MKETTESKNDYISEDEFTKQVKNHIDIMLDEYASGDLLEICRYHLGTEGKMIRSRFVHGLGSLYNCDPQKLVYWAIACELLHEASLVHDDYQDGDETRRGLPAVWQKYGGANAINAGDFLIMLAYKPFEMLGNEFLMIHTQTSLSLVQGQVDELYLNNFQLQSNYFDFYIKCIKGKTGALFASIASGVCAVKNLNYMKREKINEAFMLLGVIFQIQDDILDLYADKKRGFRGADVQEGKCSALIAVHLDNHPEDLDIIKRILLKSREETSKDDIQFIINLFDEKETLNKTIEILNNKILELKQLSSNSQFESFINKAIAKVLNPIQEVLN